MGAQTTEYMDEGQAKTLQEFFSGKDVEAKMDTRFKELEAEGHTLKRRVKIGRNDICPCGSGVKFKRCCIDKVRE